MDLAQYVETQAAGLRGKRLKHLIRVRGHDQKDGIGTVGASLQNLERVNDKVLAEHGYVDGFRDMPQIGQRAVKELLIGKHGDGGRPHGLVRPGD
jgi:hypothetical protein